MFNSPKEVDEKLNIRVKDVVSKGGNAGKFTWRYLGNIDQEHIDKYLAKGNVIPTQEGRGEKVYKLDSDKNLITKYDSKYDTLYKESFTNETLMNFIRYNKFDTERNCYWSLTKPGE
jgi:hypothetical protein